MSCNTDCTINCQTQVGGVFAVEFLPNTTIRWSRSPEATNLIGKDTIQMIMTIGDITSTFIGPPETTSADTSYLRSDPNATNDISNGGVNCKPVCYTGRNGDVTTKYVCESVGDCNNRSCHNIVTNNTDCQTDCFNTDENEPTNPCDGSGNADCDNPCDNPCNNPCDNPCDNGMNNQFANNCGPPCIPRELVDPVYAYLESNPNNVMYPTAMVPYNQTINNPFNHPTPYYKQYGNCAPGSSGGGGGGGAGPGSGCNVGNVILNINFPNTFTGTVETITGETVNDVLKFNVVVGSTDITLSRGSTCSEVNIPLSSGPYPLLINQIRLDYMYGIKNGIPTWSIYGGNINFRDMIPL